VAGPHGEHGKVQPTISEVLTGVGNFTDADERKRMSKFGTIRLQAAFLHSGSTSRRD
jgi:hypothetical protein